MKTRLPKALLIILLASLSGVAAAATMYPDKVLVVAEGETITWTNYDSMQNGDASSPLVKDGAGRLRFENVQGSTTNFYKAPLVAREGKVEIVDSTMYAHGAYTPSTPQYASTWIMVGGKDAEMSFSNSSFRIATGETHMNVGTADGSGTLSLDKTDMKVTGSIFAGFHKYSGNEDSWGLGYFYNMNGTAAADNIPAGEQNYKSLTHRYMEGNYVAGYNGHTRQFGEGTINVTNGSTLDVATALTLGYATLNVSGEGTLVKTQTGYGGIVQDGSVYEDTYAIIMGRWSGAESKIRVTDGARIEASGQLRTVRSSTLSKTKSTIEVSGKGSEFEVKATANLGIYNVAGNTTTVVAEKGGTLNFAKAVLGYNVEMSIDKDSSYTGSSMTMKDDSVVVTNAGLMSVDKLEMQGGMLTNSGTMEGEIAVNGGTFTMVDGAVAGGLTATSGTVNLQGTVTFTGMVTLGSVAAADPALAPVSGDTDALTVYIAKDTNIVLDDSILSVDGQQFVVGDNTEIIVNLGDVAYTEDMPLFTLTGTDGQLLTETADSLDDKVTVTWTDSELGEQSATATAGSITTEIVPEPATATLSLLALAGLAMRRRRQA